MAVQQVRSQHPHPSRETKALDTFWHGLAMLAISPPPVSRPRSYPDWKLRKSESCCDGRERSGSSLVSREFAHLPDQPCVLSCFSSADDEGQLPCPGGQHAFLPQAPENARLPTARWCWTALLTPLLLLLKLREAKFWNGLWLFSRELLKSCFRVWSLLFRHNLEIKDYIQMKKCITAFSLGPSGLTE